MRAFPAVGFVAGVAAIALLPLYGDPQGAAVVSHPEWARMMIRGLDLLSETPGVNDTALQVFATLSGRESRSFSADQYVHATRVELSGEGASQRLRPLGGIGEAAYALSVARAGEYRMRLFVAGPAPAEAELTRAGQNDVLRRFSIPAGKELGWVDAGSVHLDPGAYVTTVLLPEGGALQYVEMAPPCVHAIEPQGGWKPAAVTTAGDVAVTVLQALDLESELPPSGEALEFHGDALRMDDGSQMIQAAESSGAFRAGAHGAQVLLVVDVPEDGLYTLSAFGVPAGGERWLADGCQTSIVCPSTDPAARWVPILSAQLEKGRHVFAATLGPLTAIERLHLEPKKATIADYAATLERLGFTVGPEGPITREKAEEARRFLERRHAQRAADLCGDILRPGSLVAETTGAQAGGGAGAGGGPGGGGEAGGGGIGGGGGTGGGGGSVPPPIVPPVPPASPTVPTAFSGS